MLVDEGLELLTEAEALRLLASESIGRLGMSASARRPRESWQPYRVIGAAVDLFGQCASETVGGRYWSGSGGHSRHSAS